MAWQDSGPGGFEGQGGFGQFDSPSVQKGNQGSKDYGSGVKPVCLNMIKRSYIDDGFTAPDGSTLSWVTVVARVLKAEPSNMRIDYTLDDCSGSALICKQYIEEDEAGSHPVAEAGDWVRVVGGCKSFKGEAHLNASCVTPIKDPNEITSHLLETMHSYLLTNQTGGGAAGGESLTGSDLTDQVHKVIQRDRNPTGISVDQLRAALPAIKYPDLRSALDRLCGDGYIFSTTDDDHFRSTNAD